MRNTLALMLLLSARPAFADPGDIDREESREQVREARAERQQERAERRQEPADQRPAEAPPTEQRRFEPPPQRDAPPPPPPPAPVLESVAPPTPAQQDLRGSQERIDRMERADRPATPGLGREDRNAGLGRGQIDRRERIERGWDDDRRRRDGVDDGRGPARRADPPPSVSNGGPQINQQWRNQWRRDPHNDWRGYRNQHRDRFRVGIYIDPFGWQQRRLGYGSVLSSRYYSQRYWIPDPWNYRLPWAPPMYRWVRYFDDALLIDLRSGQVVDAIPDFFW